MSKTSWSNDTKIINLLDFLVLAKINLESQVGKNTLANNYWTCSGLGCFFWCEGFFNAAFGICYHLLKLISTVFWTLLVIDCFQIMLLALVAFFIL